MATHTKKTRNLSHGLEASAQDGEVSVKKKQPILSATTRKSRELTPIVSGSGVPAPDLSLPRSRRPMCGLDLEEWRGQQDLSRFDAESALGFRAPMLYNNECARPVLPIYTEILVRLYDEKPENFPWKKLKFIELFQMMYGPYIDVLDPELQPSARIDMEARFTLMFGRSPTRGYTWLRDASHDDGDEDMVARKDAKAYPPIERILQKLMHWPNPGETFERVSRYALKLRGVDIDEVFPIPTPDRPPLRTRRGRKRKDARVAAPGVAAVPLQQVMGSLFLSPSPSAAPAPEKAGASSSGKPGSRAADSTVPKQATEKGTASRKSAGKAPAKSATAKTRKAL